MIAVIRGGGLGGFPGPHAGDFFLREAVGLEIGEAPVCIAEVRAHRGGGAVGVYGLLLPAESLERVCDRQMQITGLGRVRSAGDELLVEPQRLVVTAQADHGRCICRSVRAIVRLELQQLLEFGDAFDVLVTPQKRNRVVIAGGPVVRCQGEHRFQQHVRIVEHVVRQAYAREQPHRLHVISVLQEIRPHDAFGRHQVAI